MAVKNTAQVIIAGKVFTLGGYESEEYLQTVAAFMNKKIAELNQMKGYKRLPMETKHLLLSLNIADEYYKAKRKADDLDQASQQKDQEIYSGREELVGLNLEVDSLRQQLSDAQQTLAKKQEEIEQLETRNQELEKEIDDLIS